MKIIRLVVMLNAGLMLMLSMPAMAEEQQPGKQLPSPELIEFLGEFRDDDVGIVDPLVFLNVDGQMLADLQQKGGNDEKK